MSPETETETETETSAAAQPGRVGRGTQDGTAQVGASQGAAAHSSPTTWQRMRLWGLAHAIDDLYQGLVPASVPYFVLDRHYGYVAAFRPHPRRDARVLRPAALHRPGRGP